VELPGDLTILGNPLVILLAVVTYSAQFFADKFLISIPCRTCAHYPSTGRALIVSATAQSDPAVQTAAALLTGGIALSSHLTKATTRAAINSAPTGFGNSVASVSEDGGFRCVVLLLNIYCDLIAIV
jgi:hypothetical protein